MMAWLCASFGTLHNMSSSAYVSRSGFENMDMYDDVIVTETESSNEWRGWNLVSFVCLLISVFFVLFLKLGLGSRIGLAKKC